MSFALLHSPLPFSVQAQTVMFSKFFLDANREGQTETACPACSLITQDLYTASQQQISLVFMLKGTPLLTLLPNIHNSIIQTTCKRVEHTPPPLLQSSLLIFSVVTLVKWCEYDYLKW